MTKQITSIPTMVLTMRNQARVSVAASPNHCPCWSPPAPPIRVSSHPRFENICNTRVVMVKPIITIQYIIKAQVNFTRKQFPRLTMFLQRNEIVTT